MSVTTSACVVTSQEPIGIITLKIDALDDPNEYRNSTHRLGGIKIEDDPLLTSPQHVASIIEAGLRPATLPPTKGSGLDDQYEEMLYPPVPVSSSRTITPRSMSRIPSRTIRTRSLPQMPLAPLSDGPTGHNYMPVSARPARLETFGPIEQFPRPRNRNSIVSYIGAICEPQDVVGAQITSHVFAYTPHLDRAITRTNAKKWYAKGAAKAKLVKEMMKPRDRR